MSVNLTWRERRVYQARGSLSVGPGLSDLSQLRHRLKRRVPWASRKGDDVPYIGHPCAQHHGALESEPKARVGDTAIAMQVKEPGVILERHTVFEESCFESLEAIFSFYAAATAERPPRCLGPEART